MDQRELVKCKQRKEARGRGRASGSLRKVEIWNRGVGKVQEGRELKGQGRQRGRGLELVGVEQADEEKKQG